MKWFLYNLLTINAFVRYTVMLFIRYTVMLLFIRHVDWLFDGSRWLFDMRFDDFHNKLFIWL